MKKKNILFIIPSLDSGGAEKSLVNLLQTFDYKKYKVDLLLFNKSGLFLKLVPPDVCILEIGGAYKSFSKPLFNSIVSLAKLRKPLLILSRLLYTLKINTIKNKAIAEQRSWKHIAKAIPELSKQYDVAIGYLEKSSIYYVVDKVKAKKKIGWIHTTYSNSGLSKDFDKNYFKKLDFISTITQECALDLRSNFSKQSNKIKVIQNILNPEMIKKLSLDKIGNTKLLKGESTILSIARLSEEKGVDMAIKACKIIIDSGIKVKWYIIGDGEEKEYLSRMIEKNGLENSFILLGLKENPYPYLKAADIYVQPSRYEGKSIAIDEAKVLCKPMVVTNFTSVKDQLTDNVTALIAEMTAESLAKKIVYLLHNKELRQNLIKNLCTETNGTETEIYKLYRLIESEL